MGVASAPLLMQGTAAAAPAPRVELWKARSCGCCAAWARHLEHAGFALTVHEVDDAGVVEGHVPADAVKRLLAERPAVLGLAVPGMPVGSPGMEVQGEPAEPHDVIAFAADGSRRVFAAVRS